MMETNRASFFTCFSLSHQIWGSNRSSNWLFHRVFPSSQQLKSEIQKQALLVLRVRSELAPGGSQHDHRFVQFPVDAEIQQCL